LKVLERDARLLIQLLTDLKEFVKSSGRDPGVGKEDAQRIGSCFLEETSAPLSTTRDASRPNVGREQMDRQHILTDKDVLAFQRVHFQSMYVLSDEFGRWIRHVGDTTCLRFVQKLIGIGDLWA
jgi:hypothetical protein